MTKLTKRITSLCIGFILSLTTTLLAYNATTNHWYDGSGIVNFIGIMALVQLSAQLIFFLHLNSEPKPRYRAISIVITVFFLFCIVFGSIWIMKNLDYSHKHTPDAEHVDHYMLEEQGMSH